ncbi:PPH1 [Scenedesmus sp. PABB004]|nr:PPH1 [Scenedesmus sp. PABB004]
MLLRPRLRPGVAAGGARRPAGAPARLAGAAPRAAAAAAQQQQQGAVAKACAGLSWGSACAQGPRPTMEDELRVEVDAKAGFTYAAVFDGHGGTASAEWLVEHLYDDVLRCVDARLLAPDPDAAPVPGRPGVVRSRRAEQLLGKVFQQADDELLAYLLEKKGRVTGASGATGTVALVHPQRAVFASLGDSLAVLCRNGVAVTLTSQHRVYGLGDHVLEEVERVEAAGGWIVDGRVCNVLAVSRAFGDPEFKGEGLAVLLAEGAEKGSWPRDFAAKHTFTADPVIPVPDVAVLDLDGLTDEFLVIATDGLWDCMPPPDAVRFARQQFRGGKDAQEVAAALVDIALRRYTTDNVAVVVADLKGGRDAWTAKPARGERKGLLSSLFSSSKKQ